MKQTRVKRLLALLLAAVMCIGLLPVGALAARIDADGIATEVPSAPEGTDADGAAAEAPGAAEDPDADGSAAEAPSAPEGTDAGGTVADVSNAPEDTNADQTATEVTGAPEDTNADQTAAEAPDAPEDQDHAEQPADFSEETDEPDLISNDAAEADPDARTGTGTPYTVDFTDGNAHGWTVKNGNGTATASADGLKLVGSGATFLTATDVPSFTDGYFEIEFQNHVENEGRLGFLMRLEPKATDNPSPQNTAGFYYDPNTGLTRAWSWGAWKNGTESWGSGSTDFTNLDKNPLVKDRNYKLHIQLVGSRIRADLTDLETDTTVTVVDEQMPSNFPTAAGKIGFRFWGYSDGTGEHYARATIKNIKAGELTPVTLTPVRADIAYAEAGSEDVSVTLSTDANALQSCAVNGTVLTAGTDYSVNGTTLLFKQQFIETLKTDGDAVVELVFADGLRLSFPIAITGRPEGEVDFAMDFAENGNLAALESVSGTMALEDEKLVLSQTGGVLVKSSDTPAIMDCEIHAVMKPQNNSNAAFGVYLRYVDANDYIFVGMPGTGATNEYGANWELRTPGQTVTLLTKGSRSLAERDVPYDVRVRAVGNTVTLFWDGIELAQADISSYSKGRSAGWCGVSTGRGAAVELIEVHNATATAPKSIATPENDTIASDAMIVTLDKNFPRVVSYSLGGTVVDGQVIPYYAVEVNNVEYVPAVTPAVFTDTSATYILPVLRRNRVEGQQSRCRAELDDTFGSGRPRDDHHYVEHTGGVHPIPYFGESRQAQLGRGVHEAHAAQRGQPADH